MSVIPVLRMFDVDATKDFYCNFVGMKVNWQHQHEENFPLYLQVSLGDNVIHLSEHYGDGAPGARIRIGLDNIEEWHGQLNKNYRFARPGIENGPTGKEVTIGDPNFNTLIFYQK